MKMKKLLLFCTILISFEAFSQSEELDYKHEIGLNIAPVIIPLYSGEFDLDRLELSYVKNRNKNFSWRTKLSARRTPDGGETSPSTYSALFRSDTISTNSNTTEVIRYYQKEVKVFRIYISAEYVKKIGYAKIYSGVAVVPGLASNNSYRYRSEFKTGTALGSSAFYGNFHFSSLMIGVSPYLGIKLPISDRFLLNFQTGVELDYHFRSFRPVESDERIKLQRTQLLAWPVMTELGFYVRL